MCIFALSLSACTHEHQFASEWTSDGDYHWHVATCEHDTEVSEKAEHIMDGVNCSICGYHKHIYEQEKIVPPTCTERGYTIKACECGEEQLVENSYIDIVEHNYNNAECVHCGCSVFDGDFRSISVEEAAEFVENLPEDYNKINWTEGYLVKKDIDKEQEISDGQKLKLTATTMTVKTSSIGSSLVAYAIGAGEGYEYNSGLFYSSELEMFYQDGVYYEHIVDEGTSDGVNKERTESVEKGRQSFEQCLTNREPFAGVFDVVVVEWFFGELTNGYYDDVEFSITESLSYIKFMIEVPEQTKDSTVSAKLCYVFNKDYKLVSLICDMKTFTMEDRVANRSTIIIAESSDSVPLVQNPEDYECTTHNYIAGLCEYCGHNFFLGIEELPFEPILDVELTEEDRVNGSQVKRFIKRVEGQYVSYDYYGANINIESDRVVDGDNERNEQIHININENDGVLKGDLYYASNYFDGEWNTERTDTAYILGDIMYKVGSETFKDCRGEDTANQKVYQMVYDFCGYEYAMADLSVAYESLYKGMQRVFYSVCKVGGYDVFKVQADDEYMGYIEAIYIYDADGKMVGFKARNSMSNYRVMIEIRPLNIFNSIQIPGQVVDSINNYINNNSSK